MLIESRKSGIVLGLAFLMVSGCSSLISGAKQQLAEDISATILAQDDPVMVGRAIPAYLIMVSSLVRGDPENPALLASASRLYGAYASAFDSDEQSRRLMASQSLDYARQAMCLRIPTLCRLGEEQLAAFQQHLLLVDVEDADVLFLLGSAWAGWLQANSADWNAVAELPRIQAIIERVIVLRPEIENGDAYVYQGVIRALLPPAMGGKPELARASFEEAITLSGGSNLMAKVLFAEKYARLVFDQPLHDRLLKEVIDTPEGRNGHTLINAIAKARARVLLDESPEYF